MTTPPVKGPPFVRSPYNYDVTAASDDSAYIETMPSLTVQSQTEDSDLNVLMVRFGVTGKMPENVRPVTYGDFSHITDYRGAIEAARQAEDSFMQFPAHIRAQFDNDPQLFLQFSEDPANMNTLKQWFPKENIDARFITANAASGTAPSPSPAPAPPSGAGTSSGDGGASIPK